MRVNRLIKYLFVTTFLFLEFSIPAQQTNRILAKVNNEVITLKDVENYVKIFGINEDINDIQSKLLEQIIQERLIIQLGKKDNILIPNTLVEAKLNQLASNYTNYAEFETALLREGLSLNDIKERIKDNFIIQEVINKYVNSKIKVSPKEITAYYQDNISKYNSSTKYVCWIAKADKRNFLELVGEKIKTEGIERTNNSYKDIFFKMESEEDSLREEVREAINNTSIGEFTIFLMDDTYYLIYLEKVIPPYQKSIEEVSSQIRDYLYEEKFKDIFNQWMDGLVKKAEIKIYVENN
ncbi:MAG: peptidyl-prolyl cis-trans isomerase [Candidatus Omnitrophica bacterium]|nr:peptidyl-prolyl cis-trans isomerase [Candidatus Omnitrophota bacterium]MCM8826829.1 peptidyl-prolyl cis-trans isomerase [Candidatus Omnitrophota bacterium]